MGRTQRYHHQPPDDNNDLDHSLDHNGNNDDNDNVHKAAPYPVTVGLAVSCGITDYRQAKKESLGCYNGWVVYRRSGRRVVDGRDLIESW